MKIFSKDTKAMLDDYLQWFSLKNLFLSILLALVNIGGFILVTELFMIIKYDL